MNDLAKQIELEALITKRDAINTNVIEMQMRGEMRYDAAQQLRFLGDQIRALNEPSDDSVTVERLTQENSQLVACLKSANDQFEHYERQFYLCRHEIEYAIPAMREYALKNHRHKTIDGIQDPNGVHAWLERNDAPKERESKE